MINFKSVASPLVYIVCCWNWIYFYTKAPISIEEISKRLVVTGLNILGSNPTMSLSKKKGK